MPRRIGLTGGIGSGKSRVSQTFAALGAEVIDSDAISRALTQAGGAAIEPIRAAFGVDAIDASGALDRLRMREIVFADAGAKSRLESILHPLIGAETERRAAASTAATLVFDVPLLVESGRWRERVDAVLVIDCSEATQVERVVRRSGWTAATVAAAIAQQAPRPLRLAAADAVIHNDGITLEQLDDEVRALARRWNLC